MEILCDQLAHRMSKIVLSANSVWYRPSDRPPLKLLFVNLKWHFASPWEWYFSVFFFVADVFLLTLPDDHYCFVIPATCLGEELHFVMSVGWLVKSSLGIKVCMSWSCEIHLKICWSVDGAIFSTHSTPSSPTHHFSQSKLSPKGSVNVKVQ